MTLLIDGKSVSQIEFDQFSYSEPDNFGLIYDQGKPGPSYYELPIIMTTPIEVSPPFVRRSAISADALTPGPHRMELQATDAGKNVSTASMEFVVNQPPSLN